MNKTDINVRPAIESDACAFLDLWDALDSETEFMLFEPGERKATLDAQRSRLANASGSDFVHILVLEDVDKGLLAGFCAGRRNRNARDRHTLHLVIGIRQAFTGQQWGGRLLAELEQWARRMALRRLELGVMVSNTRAISLYKKQGFRIEGTKRDAINLQSGLVDEYTMGKLL